MRCRINEGRKCRTSNLTLEMAAQMITEQALDNSAMSSLRRDSVSSKSAADCRLFQWELEQCTPFC